jgi:hypothetical protein
VSHPTLDLSEGRLSLRWRGRRLLPFFYCAPDPRPERVRAFREAGVSGVSFSTTADFHPYGLAAPAWREDGTYDHSELDRRAAQALAGFPDAMLLLRVHLCSPPWWDRAHPSELVVWDEDVRELACLHGYLKRTCASWSSRAWRAAAAANLRHLLEHARRASFGANVGGVLVASGNTEEWFQIGTMEGRLPDYSRPAALAFQRWLDGKGLDAGRLRERWGVDLGPEGPRVPPPDRRRPRRSHFRDPATDAWAMDFEEFLADEAASFIGELCGVVHDVSGGAWFAGAFFGYLAEMPFHGDGVLHGGHLGLTRALADPRIDFLASPASYARRDLRRGATQSMLPIRSVTARGKAVFHENDVRTHVLFDDAGYGWTESAVETASAQRREAAFALAHGAGLWWFDMSGTFYEDATTIEAVAGICRIAARPRPARGPAPIAFVIDEASFPVTDYWADRYSDAIPRQLLALARVGAGHDVRLLDDLDRDHGYLVLVFPNLFRVGPDRLARVRSIVAGARAAVFVGPVGLAPTGDGPPPGPAAVTGLPIEVRQEACRVEILLAAAIATSEPDAPAGFGRAFWHEARPVGDGRRVRILGTYADGGGAAFFDGAVGGTRVAYAADGVVPAAALRFLAREAGVPIALTTGDVFVTDGSLAGISASAPGSKQVAVAGAGALVGTSPPVWMAAERGIVTIPMAAGATVILVGTDRP